MIPRDMIPRSRRRPFNCWGCSFESKTQKGLDAHHKAMAKHQKKIKQQLEAIRHE